MLVGAAHPTKLSGDKKYPVQENLKKVREAVEEKLKPGDEQPGTPD